MTGKRLSEFPVIFYRSAAGTEPVRDWLRGLPAEDRRKVGIDLATIQVGWPVECRSAGRLERGCGKYAAASRADASRACCSSSRKAASVSCMASSRDPEDTARIWRWRGGG